MKNRRLNLLLQGQFVSSLGGSIYSIVIDLFILNQTGSIAIMGTVMAMVTIPRIVLSPFIGILIDRYDRKKIIVISDIISGIGILLVFFAAYIKCPNIVGIIIVVQIINSICASVLNPAIESSIADIVPKEELNKANSKYQMVTTGTDIVGQSMGGVLLSIFNAIPIFALNGLSFIYSAISEMFLQIPKHDRVDRKVTIIKDLKYGIHYINNRIGLKRIILMSFFFNFFFGIIRVAIISWFTMSPGLGYGEYGILNGVISCGMVAGMLIMSFFTIKSKDHYKFYITSIFLFTINIGIASLCKNFFLIAMFYFIGFVFQIFFNVIMGTSMMAQTAKDIRGRVLTTKTSLVLIASPIGNLLGGKICELYKAQNVILCSCIIALVVIAVCVVNREVKSYLVY